MARVIKKTFFVLIILMINMLVSTRVSALSGSISINSKSTVTVGNTFNVTVTVGESKGGILGSWSFSVGYDSSKLELISGDTKVIDYGDSTKSTQNYTYEFRAKSQGSANIKITEASIIDWIDDNKPISNVAKGSKTINIVKPSSNFSGGSSSGGSSNNYSGNNYLKSLSIEGYDIGFSKEKTTYSVNIKKGTDTISIKGDKEDEGATVRGLGEKNVKEGDNSFEITVTAENGSTRTYKINAIVEEANPVNVKIGEKDFRVVKKADLIEAPEGYEKTSIKIDDTEVPAFKNNKTKLTLIGVKDDEGNISLVVYEDGKYNPYKELKIGNLKLYQLEFPKNLIRAGYKKKEITIGDEVITVYAKEGEEYYLIYAMNLETGEKNIYKYDDKEKTIQRDFKTKIETKKEYGDEVIKAGIIAVGSFISFIGVTFKMAFKNKETM